MVKQTKQFDNLKEAKAHEKSERQQGKQTSTHSHIVRSSYKGKNKTFHDVSSW